MLPADWDALKRAACATEVLWRPPAVNAVHSPKAAGPVASGPRVADAEGVGSGLSLGSAVGSGVAVSVSSAAGVAVAVAVSVWTVSGVPDDGRADAATAVPPPIATSESAAMATFVPNAVAMSDMR
jgi:hypothetical protein